MCVIATERPWCRVWYHTRVVGTCDRQPESARPGRRTSRSSRPLRARDRWVFNTLFAVRSRRLNSTVGPGQSMLYVRTTVLLMSTALMGGPIVIPAPLYSSRSAQPKSSNASRARSQWRYQKSGQGRVSQRWSGTNRLRITAQR
jgi:hypothetical protein